MQNEDMTPAEWHNHDEYEADTDLQGLFDCQMYACTECWASFDKKRW